MKYQGIYPIGGEMDDLTIEYTTAKHFIVLNSRRYSPLHISEKCGEASDGSCLRPPFEIPERIFVVINFHVVPFDYLLGSEKHWDMKCFGSYF